MKEHFDETEVELLAVIQKIWNATIEMQRLYFAKLYESGISREEIEKAIQLYCIICLVEQDIDVPDSNYVGYIEKDLKYQEIKQLLLEIEKKERSIVP